MGVGNAGVVAGVVGVCEHGVEGDVVVVGAWGHAVWRVGKGVAGGGVAIGVAGGLQGVAGGVVAAGVAGGLEGG